MFEKVKGWLSEPATFLWCLFALSIIVAILVFTGWGSVVSILGIALLSLICFLLLLRH